MQNEKLIGKLNNKHSFVRKLALKELKKREEIDSLLIPNPLLKEVNLSIHSNLSFSPYSPTLAAYMAYKNGVKIAAVCDYGTEKGCSEFNNACNILKIQSVNGFEVTLKRKNGEEALCSFYSLSQAALDQFKPLLVQFRNACRLRAKKICEKINDKLSVYSLTIDFEKEVAKKINEKAGETLTVKHLFMEAGSKLIKKYGKGKPLANFLRETLCFDIDEGVFNLLCDANNPFYEYDLISALRHNYSEADASLTPPSFSDYLKIADECGAIVAYQYNAPDNWLKNQTESQKTKEHFIQLIKQAKSEGFNAISVSAKNLNEDLTEEFISLIEKEEMLAVFTVKTEYPRSHFESSAPARSREYLEKCAFAMIGNLQSVLEDVNAGLFLQKSVESCPNFNDRLNLFAQIGRTKTND